MEDAGEDTRVGATLARPVSEGTLAYSSELPGPETVVEPAPEPARWGVAAGLLLIGVAALGSAGVYAVHSLTAAPVTVTVTPALDPYRSPKLLNPDKDTAFLMELESTGVFYDTAGTAIYNAKFVCILLKDGQTELQIADGFAKSSDSKPAEAVSFVNISVKHYCPKD